MTSACLNSSEKEKRNMELQDIDLDFLYLNKGVVLGGVDPFWEKWGDEKSKFY